MGGKPIIIEMRQIDLQIDAFVCEVQFAADVVGMKIDGAGEIKAREATASVAKNHGHAEQRKANMQSI